LLLFVGFVLMVPGPIGLAAWYLWTRAQPQFASEFGFVIHSEAEAGTSGFLAALPAVGTLGGSSSRDTDVLARFLRSPGLVAEIDQRLDLNTLWAAGHDRDPVFALRPGGTIEDLTRYWRRMVSVHYDYSAGLMEVEARSFDPDSARAIALAIEGASSRLINRLSGIARRDRLAHATRELHLAETTLTEARQALTSFRAEQRLIDPMTDLSGDLQVIADLQRQLAEETVARDVLRQTLSDGQNGPRREESGDFRVKQSDRKIAVIRQRIEEERDKLGDAAGRRSYAQIMGEFERLSATVEIAQQAFAAALTARELARAEADRQSRYVATYARAGLPERAMYPRKAQILGMIAAGAFLTWSIMMLIVYGLRDRL
jgi:capsular polysaccharide transport system permease protein